MMVIYRLKKKHKKYYSASVLGDLQTIKVRKKTYQWFYKNINNWVVQFVNNTKKKNPFTCVITEEMRDSD